MNGSLHIWGHPLLNPTGFGQALHPPHPLLFFLLGLCSSTGAFCFLFSPVSILASMAARGISASHSAPSSPSPSFWRHFLLWVRNGRFAYFGLLISSECIVKHCYVKLNTFLVILIKLQFLIIFVPHCDYV